MTKRLPKPSAKLTIDIWTDGARHKLPRDLGEIAKLLRPHVVHVTEMVAMGMIAGDICDESFSGWWKVENTTKEPGRD